MPLYDYRTSETDWKRWKLLSSDALDRYYEKLLAEAGKFAKAPGTPKERFRKLTNFLENAQEAISEIFEDQRRTSAVVQIAKALKEGIITEQDLKPFSQETRAAVEEVRGEL